MSRCPKLDETFPYMLPGYCSRGIGVGPDVHGRPSVSDCLVIRYVPYPTKMCVGKFVFSIGGLKKTVLCLVQGLLPLICALRG